MNEESLRFNYQPDGVFSYQMLSATSWSSPLAEHILSFILQNPCFVQKPLHPLLSWTFQDGCLLICRGMSNPSQPHRRQPVWVDVFWLNFMCFTVTPFQNGRITLSIRNRLGMLLPLKCSNSHEMPRRCVSDGEGTRGSSRRRISVMSVRVADMKRKRTRAHLRRLKEESGVGEGFLSVWQLLRQNQKVSPCGHVSSNKMF